MSWSYLALLPLLLCKAACLPLGPVQRAAVRGLTWLTRLALLAGLSLLGVLLLAPQWLPAGAVPALDDWLRLPPPAAANPQRLTMGLLYAGAATLFAVPVLAVLDFSRSLGRYESGQRALTQLMRDALRLAENARPQPAAAEPSPRPDPSPAARPAANRLRTLSDLLG